MEELVVPIVGFLAATALVVVLARRSTARWERESRAGPHRRPRRPRLLRTRRVRRRGTRSRRTGGDRDPAAR